MGSRYYKINKFNIKKESIYIRCFKSHRLMSKLILVIQMLKGKKKPGYNTDYDPNNDK